MGTFNPWHKGHGRCLELAEQKNLIIAPDHNPWKKKQYPLPFDILRGIPRKGHLYTGFLGHTTANPTEGWVTRIKTAKVSLVLGDDNFMNLERWQNAPHLLICLHRLIVIPRLVDNHHFDLQKKKFLKINPQLIIERRPHHDDEGASSRLIKQKGN